LGGFFFFVDIPIPNAILYRHPVATDMGVFVTSGVQITVANDGNLKVRVGAVG